MASCVREGRDRGHLSCAAIPRVTPGSYRRGRLLLWVIGFSATSSSWFLYSGLWSCFPWFLRCSPLRRPVRAQSLFPFALVDRPFVACLRGFRWDPLWVPLFGTPFFLVLLEIFVVVVHAELSFSFLAFLPLFGGLLAGAGILAIFMAFPSCGVPARWRGLRNVVLGICGK